MQRVADLRVRRRAPANPSRPRCPHSMAGVRAGRSTVGPGVRSSSPPPWRPSAVPARSSPSTTSPAAPGCRRPSSTATSPTRTSSSTPSSSGSPTRSCCRSCSARSPSSAPTTGQALRAVIAAFVALIEDEPELYRFAYAQAGRAGRADLVAATEHQIAEALAELMVARLAEAGRPTGPAMTWAYGVVGMVQLASHWWSAARTVSSAELVDQLTALADGGLSTLLPGPPGLIRGIADERARGAGGLRGRGHRRGRRRSRPGRRGLRWPRASTPWPGTSSGPAGWPRRSPRATSLRDHAHRTARRGPRRPRPTCGATPG